MELNIGNLNEVSYTRGPDPDHSRCGSLNSPGKLPNPYPPLATKGSRFNPFDLVKSFKRGGPHIIFWPFLGNDELRKIY